MKIIPRTMSTQHPDNYRMPFFTTGQIIDIKDEITEALWAYSIGIEEVMWDYEGKNALQGVVSKLLKKDKQFFLENALGKKLFLTLRIPNPAVEKNDAKVVAEVLESIPLAYDKAQDIYQNNFPPIFEVILPMCTASEQLDWAYYYYQNLVAGKGNCRICPGGITVSEWLGEFMPKNINLIPLVEDKESQLNADKIVAKYLAGKNLEYVRIMLARSDSALNYGCLAAVLLLNVALQRLHQLEKKSGISIYPIIGAGDGYRGNFNPIKVASMMQGYPSCQTFTIQSAFKYDWNQDIVAEAVKKINQTKRGKPIWINEEKSIYLIEKSATAYQKQIPEIATLVNQFTQFIPSRRERKLHIGLFGYSRSVGKTHLPRAIPFGASLYSLGLPPILLGLYRLNSNDIKQVRTEYPGPNFEEDLRDALSYFNPDFFLLASPEMRKQIKKVLRITDFEININHQKITSEIIRCFKKKQEDSLKELVLEAGRIRKFLG